MREKLKIHDGDTPGKTFELKLEYPKPKVATMSDMKCPFCQQDLDADCINYVYLCRNKKCKETNGLIGSAKMWNKIGGLLEDIELARHNEYVWNITCEEISIKRNAIQQELARTRKALDVAIDWLEQVATLAKCDDDLCREFTKRKLAEIKKITEQKDK